MLSILDVGFFLLADVVPSLLGAMDRKDICFKKRVSMSVSQANTIKLAEAT
jgi:hypothetical protein